MHRRWIRFISNFVSTALVAVLASAAPAAIVDGLAFYLPLDADASDASPHSIETFAQNSVTFDDSGVVGQAARISNSPGVDSASASFVSTSEQLTLGTDDFSVSIWVRGDDALSINHTDSAIISNKDWNSGLNLGWAIARGTVGGGGGWQWNFASTAGGRVDFDPPAASSSMEDSQWHHIVVTHDRDAEAVFYFDGNVIGERDISSHQFGSVDAGLPTTIGTDGAYGETWDAYLNGFVDEAAIWRRVLDSSEVESIYVGGLAGLPMTQVADPLRLTLEVNRDSGELTLRNDTTNDIDLRGYSVLSPVGALDPTRWTSISQRADADSGRSIDADDRWIEFTDRTTFGDLSEGSLGVGTIPAGQTFSLGEGTWRQYFVEELHFEYLDSDHQVVSSAVEYSGNGGNRFLLGDLNFDGQLDDRDWIVFADGLGRSGYGSIAEAYQGGDLNGDLTNDHADFLVFQRAYDVANGEGAFAKLVANVPEPTASLMLVIGVLLVVNRYRRSAGYVVLFGVAVWYSNIEAMAQVVLFEEDFESQTAELGPFVSPTESGGDGTDWTNVPPVGWSVDNRSLGTGGVPEFAGWTFLDTTAWSRTAGDQQRSQFTFSDGVVAVADPDEWQDSAASGEFNSFLQTPPISLVGTNPGTVVLEFDSSWRDEASQTALLMASFDGGADQELLRWESVASSRFFKDDTTNERVEVPIIHPDGAQTMVLKWGLVDAGNNWWWAIDNVIVQQEDQERALKLNVNTTTGAIELANDTSDSIELNYYEIESTGGSLKVEQWNSLDRQRIDEMGPLPTQHWTQGGGSDSNRLIEAFLSGSSTIDVGASISLGGAYDVASDIRDLIFSYGTVDGSLHSGIVRYEDAGLLCDFDGDGRCGLSDIDALLQQGDLVEGVSDAAASFDANRDGRLNEADISLWLELAGAAKGFSQAILHGDANLDGVIDAQDLNRVGRNWQQTGLVWSEGDFNGDGNVDAQDLNDVGLNWQKRNSEATVFAAAVPESNRLWLWWPAAFLMARRLGTKIRQSKERRK